jgi:tetratricopeptide (TPR) repeat protein
VSAFALDVPGTGTESAYRHAVETRDPDTFFTLKKAMEAHYQELTLPEALALVRLAHWDADIFSALFAHLDALDEPPDVITRADLLFTIDRVWEAYYPVGEDDLSFRLAALLYAMGEYRLALEYFGRAQESPPGASVDAWLNCALCHQLLGEDDEAIACVGEALSLAPGLKAAHDLLEELRLPHAP